MITRQIETTDGTETRMMDLEIRDDGTTWLHDQADVNNDAWEQIPDDSDSSIADAIRGNGFEIAD